MEVLTRFSLKRASIIILLTLLVIGGGAYSALQLKSELLPDIALPVVSVVAIYPGAAPDDVRRDVTEPIEKAVAGTPNLKTLTSTSNDSVAFISGTTGRLQMLPTSADITSTRRGAAPVPPTKWSPTTKRLPASFVRKVQFGRVSPPNSASLMIK